MARKKISTTIYITPEQNELLKALNQRTKVPVAEYIRQGIDLVLEKAPHTLARGHWSISGYQDARRKLESAIAKLGHLSNQVAADARIRLPVVPERAWQARPPRPNSPVRPAYKPGGLFQRFVGGVKKKFATSTEAA